MKKTKFEQSPLYLEIQSNGQIVYEAYYNFLKDVFEKEPESRHYFYEEKIADKATEILLPREKVSVEAAHNIFNKLNAEGFEESMIEIGVFSNEQD
ncbi:hypothetical protein SCHIN_v1c05460 [Spiroplasma chinense]|uniref:Uncharacterized protein n=1 Tax=Spiroplasma chinense TaxID=216932 RepID=A0A5B9Y4P4_9MOLU|nr:hypothetical protein [Spiroplasma chinense]QEH61743.1 hypothetical protein SCHIN_v1c05460 [Spiroplasma chinense]